jgi:hypothetical protein
LGQGTAQVMFFIAGNDYGSQTLHMEPLMVKGFPFLDYLGRIKVSDLSEDSNSSLTIFGRTSCTKE